MQAIIDLGEGHLSLVDLYADLQSVGLGSHSLAYHLLHVAVELLDKREEALSQCLLMFERDDGPVSLVDIIECELFLSFGRVGGHDFSNVCHLVHGDDGSTHKQRLCDLDSGSKHVACVGMERIDKSLSSHVEHIGKSTCGLLRQ